MRRVALEIVQPEMVREVILDFTKTPAEPKKKARRRVTCRKTKGGEFILSFRMDRVSVVAATVAYSHLKKEEDRYREWMKGMVGRYDD